MSEMLPDVARSFSIFTVKSETGTDTLAQGQGGHLQGFCSRQRTTYDDAQLVSKILRGLTPRYNNLVDQYHLLNQDINNDVKEMTTKLQTYESKLLERDEEKKANKAEKPPSKGESSKGDKSGGNKPCGKTGHTEEECYMKKRHQTENSNSNTDGKDKKKPKENSTVVLTPTQYQTNHYRPYSHVFNYYSLSQTYPSPCYGSHGFPRYSRPHGCLSANVLR